MKNTKVPVSVILLAFSALIASVPGFAQDKPADNMQIFREKLRADKTVVVAEVMQLTEAESKSFWPVYENYQAESKKVNDRLIGVIQSYASQYASLTDSAAKKLLDDSMAIEADRQKLRQTYLPKFRQVLPEVKVARFYQVENKIQAVVNYELAAGIHFAQ